MSKKLGKVVGSAGEVAGRYSDYSILTSFSWHSVPQATTACGRMSQSLNVVLHIEGITGSENLRKRSAQLGSEPVKIILGDVTFAGTILHMSWVASVDEDGVARSANLTIQCEGFEQ